MTTTLSSEATSQSAGGTDNRAPVAYPPRARSYRWVFGAVALIIVLVGAGAWNAASRRDANAALASVDKFRVTIRSFTVSLTEKGELKAANSTDIKSEVEGRATIISLVPEGTAVEKGDLLVELASDEIEERIQIEELRLSNAETAAETAAVDLEIQLDKNASDVRKADLQIELKQLALDKYEKGDWVQQLKDAEVAIEQADILLQRRRDDFEAAGKLKKKGYITRTEFEEDEFNYKKAEWEVDKAQLALEVLQKYTNKADQRQRESDLEEARKERGRLERSTSAEETRRRRAVEGKTKELELVQEKLAKLLRQKERCKITAPAPGFVVYYADSWRWGSDDQIKEGATVYERQVLMQLPDTSKMNVKVRIHEAKTDRISVGQHVVIEVEGVPGEQFTGTVTKIAVVADTQNRWLNPDLKEYETEITLDPTDVPLKPGGTAHVEILVQTVEDAVAVPVQSIFSKGGRRYVFRYEAGSIEPVEVQIGAVGTEWAQINDGLAAGDEICLAVSDEHKRLLPEPPKDEPSESKTALGQTKTPTTTETAKATDEVKPAVEKTKAKPSVSGQSGGVRKHGGL